MCLSKSRFHFKNPSNIGAIQKWLHHHRRLLQAFDRDGSWGARKDASPLVLSVVDEVINGQPWTVFNAVQSPLSRPSFVHDGSVLSPSSVTCKHSFWRCCGVSRRDYTTPAYFHVFLT